MVGSYLIPYFSQKGHSVFRLLRNPKKSRPGDILWDPAKLKLDHAPLSGFQVIIHLSGENLANWLWTKKQKDRIKKSRIDSTRLLAGIVSEMPDPKPVFLCASASGYYGDRGGEILTEQSSAGSGFLAEVVREWEDAADAARQAGVRVVHLRLGVILSSQGGFLSRIVPLFKLGLGDRIGNGRQFMAWISLEDVAEIIDFCIDHADIAGPVNVVAPEGVTNKQFTENLAGILKRPSFLSVPAGLLRTLLGEMADEMFLSSSRLEPQLLLKRGYTFRQPTLRDALKSVLSIKTT